ncbi:MAG: nucleoside/nucleotide kinase family protein [Rhodobiaceae bacterium]|nr:nucleoside/nucleotide kinase family protein [Rhodobiaceae bacterium]
MQPVDLETLSRLLLARPETGRSLVAVAGPPASGKSTLAEGLVERLNAERPGVAALLPMDGYHFDDLLLVPWRRRARKGAPDTFDVGGFRAMLRRLRDNAEEAIAVPVFDRDIEIARAGARMIPNTARLIVVEGNYLLLRTPPWDTLKPLFDVTVMIETDAETLRRRLTARWQGYDLPADEVRRKVEENDLPNGLTVIADSAEADYVIAT